MSATRPQQDLRLKRNAFSPFQHYTSTTPYSLPQHPPTGFYWEARITLRQHADRCVAPSRQGQPSLSLNPAKYAFRVHRHLPTRTTRKRRASIAFRRRQMSPWSARKGRQRTRWKSRFRPCQDSFALQLNVGEPTMKLECRGPRLRLDRLAHLVHVPLRALPQGAAARVRWTTAQSRA